MSSTFVSLNKAVAVESEMVGSQGDVKVTVSYESRKSFRLVMDGLRFAKFARLARKHGIPVNGINGAVGPATAKKLRAEQLPLFEDGVEGAEARAEWELATGRNYYAELGARRVTVIDRQSAGDHQVRILFNSRREAQNVDWDKVSVDQINGIILDTQIVVSRDHKEGLLFYICRVIKERKPALTVRGNQISFTL